jgi:DNA-directed RNA polymerase specialized sigma24 family protein
MTGNSLILPRKDELAVLAPSKRSLCNLEDEKGGNLSQESFDRLLAWLHQDRDEAGRIYENIRSALIAGFRSHGCSFPDKLADQTIDRVARKFAEMVQPYVGDPRPYFYRVAFYVRLEHLRKEVEVEELPDDLNLPVVVEDVEPEFECLEQCMDTLPPRSRDIVLKYYQGEKRVKIELRKALASSLSLSLPALRLKAQRIRAHLKTCIMACLMAKSRLQDSIPPFNTTGAIVEFESEA